jgi:cystathionine gamma-synthase/cystathionine gamma-lyase/cystathionine beta-lyase
MTGPERGAPRVETLAVHGGERRPGPEGSLVYPIYQGTVFPVEPGTAYEDIRYHRLSTTPSQTYLHDKLAALEGGEAAVATSSGMAALTTVMLSLLREGDHLIASDSLYGGTHDFITEHARGLGWSFTFVDTQRPETWPAALRSSTKLFLAETITNPLVRVPPLEEIVAFARAEGLISVIDNTFATPVNFNPLALGFDLCCHSATKYLNGHNDLVAGCVIGSGELVGRVRRSLNHFGGVLDPHAGFLLARGLKTLALRVAAHNANAMALARFLDERPAVGQVNYPGLPAHPDHDHAARLLSGFGGMLSMRLEEGLEATERVLAELRIATVAPSLGGVQTLVTLPAVTSHAGMSAEERERTGLSEDLVRISCGVEGTEDLVADFARALGAGGGDGRVSSASPGTARLRAGSSRR